MRISNCLQQLPYAFDQVVTVFWERYPNSKSKHVVSEDLIEVVVDGDQIRTKKLLLKNTGTFMKAVPKWISRLPNVKVIPTIEHSIYDRSKRMLVTYTRNITMMSTCLIHERCIYKPEVVNGKELPKTIIERGGYVSTFFGRLNSMIERVLMANFRKSMKKAVTAYSEKLKARYGDPMPEQVLRFRKDHFVRAGKKATYEQN